MWGMNKFDLIEAICTRAFDNPALAFAIDFESLGHENDWVSGPSD